MVTLGNYKQYIVISYHMLSRCQSFWQFIATWCAQKIASRCTEPIGFHATLSRLLQNMQGWRFHLTMPHFEWQPPIPELQTWSNIILCSKMTWKKEQNNQTCIESKLFLYGSSNFSNGSSRSEANLLSSVLRWHSQHDMLADGPCESSRLGMACHSSPSHLGIQLFLASGGRPPPSSSRSPTNVGRKRTSWGRRAVCMGQCGSPNAPRECVEACWTMLNHD